MDRELKVTLPLLKVLRAFARADPSETYGSKLSQDTGLKSGTLYPILARLEQSGLATSKWEDIDPVKEGRPARRLYKLTGMGVRYAETHLREAEQLFVPTGALVMS